LVLAVAVAQALDARPDTVAERTVGAAVELAAAFDALLVAAALSPWDIVAVVVISEAASRTRVVVSAGL
jgi:hypothetical protein